MTVQFTGSSTAISDWTSYSIERDFFTGADHFHLTMEDDRATQLNSNLQIGNQLKFFINNQLVLIGYIDDYTISMTPDTGTVLTVTGRDLLGVAAQSVILPNMGTSTNTNFIFPASTTYLQAFQVIFDAFQTGLGANVAITDDDSAMLKLSTGGRVGAKIKGKTVKGQTRSLSTSLSHNYKPELNETYLSYAKRLAATIGCFIKIVINGNGTEDILISPPTYDRDNTDFYTLVHNKQSTNVLYSNWNISYKDQPSVIIGQCTYGQPGYKKQTQKCVRINEITGYKFQTSSKSFSQNPLKEALPSVSQTVAALTTGNIQTQQQFENTNNPGYYLMPSNSVLRDVLQNIPIQVNTQYSRAHFYESYNAHTKTELEFDVAFEMSKKQNEFIEVVYEVENHTCSNGTNFIVWQPDLLCNVQDTVLSSNGNPFNAQLWIQKVVFSRDTSHGPITKLTLRLPYVFIADIVL